LLVTEKLFENEVIFQLFMKNIDVKGKIKNEIHYLSLESDMMFALDVIPKIVIVK
jgi:hypothetical protein